MKNVKNILFYFICGLLIGTGLFGLISELSSIGDLGQLSRESYFASLIIDLCFEIFVFVYIIICSCYLIYKNISNNLDDKKTNYIFGDALIGLNAITVIAFFAVVSIYSTYKANIPAINYVTLVFSIVNIIIFSIARYGKNDSIQKYRHIIFIVAFCLTLVNVIIGLANSDSLSGLAITCNVFFLLTCLCGVGFYAIPKTYSFASQKESTYCSKDIASKDETNEDPTEALKKLHDLLEKGIISQEIYDEKSKKYIDRL